MPRIYMGLTILGAVLLICAIAMLVYGLITAR